MTAIQNRTTPGLNQIQCSTAAACFTPPPRLSSLTVSSYPTPTSSSHLHHRRCHLSTLYLSSALSLCPLASRDSPSLRNSLLNPDFRPRSHLSFRAGSSCRPHSSLTGLHTRCISNTTAPSLYDQSIEEPKNISILLYWRSVRKYPSAVDLVEILAPRPQWLV
jgi:hypothetical protein